MDFCKIVSIMFVNVAQEIFTYSIDGHNLEICKCYYRFGCDILFQDVLWISQSPQILGFVIKGNVLFTRNNKKLFVVGQTNTNVWLISLVEFCLCIYKKKLEKCNINSLETFFLYRMLYVHLLIRISRFIEISSL